MRKQSNKKIINAEFFNRPAPEAARRLLGKFLVRRLNGKTIAAMITEVEAYDGPRDRASHASRGRTPRNEPMFGKPGRLYVYFVYGNHFMLNVVTGKEGYPAAILIRGVSGINGPGRLTKAFKINKSLNGRAAAPKTGLWFENRGIKLKKTRVGRSPRVGVGYAGPVWSKKRYRFFIKSAPRINSAVAAAAETRQ